MCWSEGEGGTLRTIGTNGRLRGWNLRGGSGDATPRGGKVYAKITNPCDQE
jgi:hypothetical protein